MSSLTDQDIDFIIEDLEKRGLIMPVLKDKLADHICCIIEPDLENGIDFRTSYKTFINNLEEDTLRNIQQKTILSTNLNYQKMKKTMFVLGISGTLFVMIGAFLKTNHLPPAGVALVLGALLILFGFLPLFFAQFNKQFDPFR